MYPRLVGGSHSESEEATQTLPTSGLLITVLYSGLGPTSPQHNRFSTPPSETGVQGCAPPPRETAVSRPQKCAPPLLHFFLRRRQGGAPRARPVRPSGGHFQRTRDARVMIFFVFVLFFCLGAAERRPNANYYYSPLWLGIREGMSTTRGRGKQGEGGNYREGDYMGGHYREGDYRGKGLQCGGLATVHSLAAPLSHPPAPVHAPGRLLPSSATLSKKGHQPWR